MMNILSNKKIHILAIYIVGFAVYSSAFGNTFIGDNELFVKTWEGVRHLSNIPNLFLGNDFNAIRFRPIGSTFLTIYYQFFGQEPLGYIITSLLWHIASGVMIYLIVEQLVGSRLSVVGSRKEKTTIYPLRSQSEASQLQANKSERTTNYLSLIVALIFVVHPVNNEAVLTIFSNITFAYFLYFAAFYFHITKKYVISIILAVCAFLSYELTYSLPLVVIFWDLWQNNFSLKKGFWKLLPLKVYGVYFSTLLVFLFVRFFVFGIVQNATYLDGNFFLTMLVMMKVFLIYIKLLIFPVLLTINRTILPGVQVWIDPFTNVESLRAVNFFMPQVLGGFLLAVGFLYLAFWVRNKYKIATFAIGWYFISLLPISYLLPQDTIMQERYIYLGSFAYSLVLGWLLSRGLGVKGVLRVITIITVITIIIAYSARTYIRNLDWKDPITMWTKLVGELPDHPSTLNQLAGMHYEKGNFDEALGLYLHIAELQPRAGNVYYQIATIYQRRGEHKKASENYYLALKNTPFEAVDHEGNSVVGYTKEELVRNIEEEFASNSQIYPWLPYQLSQRIMVWLPKDWKTVKLGTGIRITPDDDFVVNLIPGVLLENETAESYLKKQTKTYGKLQNEGLASVPNFDFSYVRVWSTFAESSGEREGKSSGQTLQFFLINGQTIVEAVVSPADSPNMAHFEETVRSIIVL